jgi:hypothetical protein
VLPPPPLSRLQPIPGSSEVLAPFDDATSALRPEWAHPDASLRDEVLRSGWELLEESAQSEHHPLWRALQSAVGRRTEGGPGEGGLTTEHTQAALDDLPPWKVRQRRCASRCVSSWGSCRGDDTPRGLPRLATARPPRTCRLQILMLVEHQMRDDAASRRASPPRRRSAEQYASAARAQRAYGVIARALHFLKLSDTARLPVERATLRSLLANWSAVVHTGVGPCPACDKHGAAPADANVDEPPPLESRVLQARGMELDVDEVAVRPRRSLRGWQALVCALVLCSTSGSPCRNAHAMQIRVVAAAVYCSVHVSVTFL